MSDSARLLDILDYWHKVEFFIPFDLDQVLGTRDDWSTKWLIERELPADPSSLWRVAVPQDRVLSGFKLYLGVFEMEAIEKFAQTLPMPVGVDAFDEAERTELDGRSCIASVSLNAHGEPIFEAVSVSTAPWALGQATRHGLAALSAGAFAEARERLGERLQNFQSARLRERFSDDDGDSPLPLSKEELLELLRLFVDWCGYEPTGDQPVALMQVLTTRAKKNTEDVGAIDASAREPADAADDIDDDDTVVEQAPAIDILNSFYIEDIERGMASVRDGDIPVTLRAYLTPLDDAQRVDLYTPHGRQAIVDALHPRRFNAGHWLEDASRKMSLMQQFAINAALGALEQDGLFSVNGPPGTGKTTLLRDVICENVVRRARLLAALPKAGDALASVATEVQFADKTVKIRALLPELTGFEMVVASSNNAAVENISNDLPKRKQLGQAWRDMSHLQPVAHKIAAQTDEGKFAKLEPGDVPWGLISCVLGRAQNRRRFAERFYFGELPEHLRDDSAAPCHIRDWVARYTGVNFDNAKRAFLKLDDAVRTAIEERARYADLHAELSAMTESEFTRQAQSNVDAAEASERDAAAATRIADDDLRAQEARLTELQEDERLIDRSAPGRLARLFRTGTARRHAVDVGENAQAQREIRGGLSNRRKLAKDRESQLRQSRAELDRARTVLDETRAVWTRKHAALSQFQERFASIPMPASLDALETDEVQMSGMWQDEGFAHLRSQLFAAGLMLHQAWLADVARKNGPGFGGNLFAINRLLIGKWPDNPAHVPLIWQSLFMIVPVVSTTFASFARQFRHMGPGSIGWLFIDEAGQAVPQAAVGALWRAKRAMVVGDPLQIEPVFTVPTRLIDALAQSSPHTASGECSPARTSVQRLADDANPYGTRVSVDGERPLWIGSPLRVHRRCADPMFSIANRIAYQGKMVFGLDTRDPPGDAPGFGKSAWVDVRGKTERKQVVPRQIELVVELVAKSYAKDRSLPPLYVISPFKAVKDELRRRLLEIDWQGMTGERGPSRKAWSKWCADRVGTVHTFQGKEEKIVVFVLGADRDGRGAAVWAASKPNLLNVALTRAQHRIYVIGDAGLWGGLPHFDAALPLLEGTTAEAWLDRLDVA